MLASELRFPNCVVSILLTCSSPQPPLLKKQQYTVQIPQCYNRVSFKRYHCDCFVLLFYRCFIVPLFIIFKPWSEKYVCWDYFVGNYFSLIETTNDNTRNTISAYVPRGTMLADLIKTNGPCNLLNHFKTQSKVIERKDPQVGCKWDEIIYSLNLNHTMLIPQLLICNVYLTTDI